MPEYEGCRGQFGFLKNILKHIFTSEKSTFASGLRSTVLFSDWAWLRGNVTGGFCLVLKVCFNRIKFEYVHWMGAELIVELRFYSKMSLAKFVMFM